MWNTSKREIARAQNLASNAISIFTKTVEDLTDVNERLTGVIMEEHQAINEHQDNIDVAKNSIESNKRIISKIKNLTA